MLFTKKNYGYNADYSVCEKCFKRFMNLVLLMLFTNNNNGYNADMC